MSASILGGVHFTLLLRDAVLKQLILKSLVVVINSSLESLLLVSQGRKQLLFHGQHMRLWILNLINRDSGM